MSKITLLYLLKSHSAVYCIIAIASFFTFVQSAYAFDSQTTTVNGITTHYLPNLSCYKLYEVIMKPGGIVAWINNDISYDLISITKNNANQSQSITSNNFTVNNANAVPEFGQVSYVILAFSIISVLAVSAKSSLNSKI